MKTRTVSIRT